MRPFLLMGGLMATQSTTASAGPPVLQLAEDLAGPLRRHRETAGAHLDELGRLVA